LVIKITTAQAFVLPPPIITAEAASFLPSINIFIDLESIIHEASQRMEHLLNLDSMFGFDDDVITTSAK